MTKPVAVPVTIHVPEPLVLRFQTRALRLLEDLASEMDVCAGEASDDAWPIPASEARDGQLWGPRARKWGTNSDDQQRAEWVLQDLTTASLELLIALFRQPGVRHTGDTLAVAAGYAHGARSVPPAFKAVGGRCRRVKRAAMWDWRAGDTAEAAGTYVVTSDATARVFEKALDQVRPGWRNDGR